MLSRASLLIIIPILGIVPARVSADSPSEASRVRILLVLDTLDKQGATWGLDGDNMKSVLEAGLQKQKLDKRYTLDIVTGRQVTPENILAYYAALKTEPAETLLFYYSGHGGLNAAKGHFLALKAGHLYRKDLLAAMKKHQARLVVLLTDCCANPAGGAIFVEPPKSIVAAIQRTAGKSPRALQQEPAGQVRLMKDYQSREIEAKRPNLKALTKGAKAKRAEPAFTLGTLAGKLAPAGPRARNEEPAGTVSKKVNLVTGKGTVAVDDIAMQMDGAVLRHLLFRHEGIVDINGCKKGAVSLGTEAWGGSIFTIAFLALQKERIDTFDKNGNRLVEWDEFLPLWLEGTEAAGQRATRGRSHQAPEAFELNVRPTLK